RATYETLRALKISREKIFSRADLLTHEAGAIEDNYNAFLELGLSRKNINTHLIGHNSESIAQNYKALLKLGIQPKRIATLVPLLTLPPQTLDERIDGLEKLGIKKEGIAKRPELLARDPETIRYNYILLVGFGITEAKLVSKPALLGQNPDTLQQNGRMLRQLGLKPEKIASQSQLLGMDPAIVWDNVVLLLTLGFMSEQIALQPQLLGKNPVSTMANYRNLRRFFPKDTILKFPALMCNSPKTIEASVQFLCDIGIDYEQNPALCASTPHRKRAKIAMLMKEAGYSGLDKNGRKELRERTLEFLRKRPYAFKTEDRKVRGRFKSAA
ncbi:MAG: hypothetical protein V1861_04880, partial [Candidatus Micrarchaeota archaeon]